MFTGNIPHLCESCGETDPSKFASNRKTTCKPCARQKYNSKEYSKSWRELNKENFKLYDAKHRRKKGIQPRTESEKKSYRDTNLDAYRAYQATYQKTRRQQDPAFQFIANLRNRQKQVLKGLASTTLNLGCTSIELRAYIEQLWEPWMSWDNYGIKEGQWSLDHKIPLDSYDRTAESFWDNNSDYNKKLVHYTNLQPLLHSKNRKKSNKVER